jgi:hypothetical protein
MKQNKVKGVKAIKMWAIYLNNNFYAIAETKKQAQECSTQSVEITKILPVLISPLPTKSSKRLLSKKK